MNRPSSDAFRRLEQAITVVMFVVAIALPLAAKSLGFAPPDAANENRRLATLPAWGWNRGTISAYPRKLEAYYNDHLGFRGPLLRAYGWVQYFLLKESPTRYVVIGKEGWLFYSGVRVFMNENPIADFKGTRPLHPSRLEQWKTVLEARRDWLAEREIPYLLVVVPNKSSVYPEYMPPRIRRTGGAAPGEQLVTYLQEHSDLKVLDLLEPLRAAKASVRLYHRADTHWNGCGGFYGYRALATALQTWFPSLVPFDSSQVEVTSKIVPGGELARLTNLQDWIDEEHLQMKARFELRAANIGEPWTQENWERPIMTGTEDESLPDGVIIGDSFMGGFSPFIQEHFRHMVYQLTYGKFPVELIEKESPDIVIEEVVERFLRRLPRNPPELNAPETTGGSAQRTDVE